MAGNNCINAKTTGIQSLDSTGAITGRTVTGTANQFTITNGAGTAGNPVIEFSSAVHETSTQPVVLAYQSATSAAVTGDGTVYTVIFNTETNDQGSNYDNTTGIFTAPIDGNYSFMGNVGFGIFGFGTTTTFSVQIVTTPATLPCTSNAVANVGSTNIIWCPFQAVVRLSSGNTAKIQAIGAGGTKTNTIFGGAGWFTWFSCSLLN